MTNDSQTPETIENTEANAEAKANEVAPKAAEAPQEAPKEPAKPKYKITLSDEGKIFYQSDITNPLPGQEVGALEKGEAVLSPKIKALETSPLAQDELEQAVNQHLQEVLSAFYKLPEKAENETPAVSAICEALYREIGMLERASVQSQITELDNDARAALRAKGVRFGPIFLYCPEMNKPAALRLRALLWALFNDMKLPAQRVPDGMVSKLVESVDEPIDAEQKALYRALCYPVYGGRAIRIDMLDRVVNAVYEGADKGKFQAQHSMAEWLGCPIADLYKVLEALGHTKIHDPADELKAQEEAAVAASALAQEAQTDPQEEVKPVEVKAEAEAETKAEEPASSPDTVEASTEAQGETPAETKEATPQAAPQPQVKPELATFQLKRGKANQQGGGKRFNNNKAGGKGFKKDGDFKKKPFKGKKNAGKGGKRDPRDNKPRVISSGPDKPSLENSPFAVLGQLKK